MTDHAEAPKSPAEVFQMAHEAVDFIRTKIPAEFHRPRVAIVCGSGLGGIANTVRDDEKHAINYSDIPYFPKTTGR